MLNARENFYETIKRGGKPERLVCQYENMTSPGPNPESSLLRPSIRPGMAPVKDAWGTEIIWPEGVPGSMPHVTAENKVIPDITRWRETAKTPDLSKISDPRLWDEVRARAAAIDRGEKMVMTYVATGVFEQLHFLMGFEDMLMSFLIEPEAMKELCDHLGDFVFERVRLLVENIRPDIMNVHDDWGSKTSLFISPDTWREFIKPQYVKTYKYLRDNGVVVLHHADSFLEPIVEDMVELGVDVWQGVLPQNDIVKLQKQLGGRMTLMGGIDAAIVDRDDSTEAEIRAETRRACETYGPGGGFIPCITYGVPGTIHKAADAVISDEIRRYNAAR